MGKPLMIQQEDEDRILDLKEKTGAKTKIEVVRSALDLLQEEVEREQRVRRWQKATKMVGKSGLKVMRELKNPHRFKNF